MIKRLIVLILLCYTCVCSILPATDLKLNIIDNDDCLYVATKPDKELTIKLINYSEITNDYMPSDKFEVYREDITTRVNNYNLAWKIARSLIGTKGSCKKIVNDFIELFYGYTTGELVRVSFDDAMAGDIIYYSNGGLGSEHWAIWLGDDCALQGNYNGTTIIATAHLRNASEPLIYRYN